MSNNYFQIVHIKYTNNIFFHLAIRALIELFNTSIPTKGKAFPKINGPKPGEKVCIVGAGPAGIDIAVRLKERGFKNITLLESTGRVGGKSYDEYIDGFYRPLGTLYLTIDYFDNFIALANKYKVGTLETIRDGGVSNIIERLQPCRIILFCFKE